MKNNVKIQDDTQSLQSCVSVSVTDLRIGNYISRLDLGSGDPRNEKILELLSKRVVTTGPCRVIVLYEDIKPIPITEDLLLKLGAIKLDFKDFPSFNLIGTQINFINGIWIDYITRVEIKGLHHLQNIFFFRNSEELQISCLTEH